MEQQMHGAIVYKLVDRYRTNEVIRIQRNAAGFGLTVQSEAICSMKVHAGPFVLDSWSRLAAVEFFDHLKHTLCHLPDLAGR
jgi:hypothetical protein